MPNLHRGEIEVMLDGNPMTLCLTLGALAELEAAFGEADMLSLASRFAQGRLSARDAIRVLGAGLRGAGHDLADADVACMQTDGGASGFVDAVARLLTATFGVGAGTPPSASAADRAAPSAAKGEAGTADPFPGRR
jgi:hypothetical protein